MRRDYQSDSNRTGVFSQADWSFLRKVLESFSEEISAYRIIGFDSIGKKFKLRVINLSIK